MKPSEKLKKQIKKVMSGGASSVGLHEMLQTVDEVAQLEAKIRAYEEILKVSTIPSENVREYLIRAGYVIHDAVEPRG